MEINCPICSISIEITEAHIGQKGRCTTCESKFIIPENPDDEFEILVRGEAPEKSATTLRPVTGAAAGQPVSVRPITIQSNGPSAVTVGIVATCIAIGIALVAANRDEHPQQPKPQPNAPSAATSTTAPAPAPSPAEKINSAMVTPTADPEPIALTKPLESPPAPAEVAMAAPVEDLPPALTEEQKASALNFLKSNQVSKRKAGYNGFRKLGDREKSAYLELLGDASLHHSNELSKVAFDLAMGKNELAQFKEEYDAWLAAADSAKNMAQTDWKEKSPDDYKKKHAEMDEATEKAVKLYTKTMRAVNSAHQFKPASFQPIIDALNEIRAEIAWCESREPDSPMSLRDELSSAGADDYVETLGKIDAAKSVADELAAAESFNASSAWANGAYQTFATVLNGRRVALGLIPVRLDEQLSNACKDHSEDMANNGYFSHSGRTDETRSFGDRAKRANFTGFATGECIFMGNPSPNAAHDAWWYSDGHRLIMYANNPNTLGLGLYGKHWTLNTGKK